MVSTKTFLDTVVEGVLAILRKHNVDSKWDQVYKFKACRHMARKCTLFAIGHSWNQISFPPIECMAEIACFLGKKPEEPPTWWMDGINYKWLPLRNGKLMGSNRKFVVTEHSVLESRLLNG